MNDNNDIFADPWLKKSKEINSLPEDLLLVCAYNLDIIADIIEEAAFFRRTETSLENLDNCCSFFDLSNIVERNAFYSPKVFRN